MKKRDKVSGYLILTLMIMVTLIPVWSYLAWYFYESKQINILTLDKTVPFEKRDEHISWFWVLNHYKYFKPDGTSFHEEMDYKGFFPDKADTFTFEVKDLVELNNDSLSALSDSLDIYYIADTYGVYEHEWNEVKTRPAFSKKVYGGAAMNDYLLAKEMLERDKLVIAESNILASPTSSRVRRKFQQLFNVEWSGWVGKYYVSLDTLASNEIPMWVTELYHQQYRKDWSFEAGGIVLVNSDSRIVILDEEKDLVENIPLIKTDRANTDRYGITENVHYPFWFEITFPDSKDSVDVISWFQIESTKSGDSLLHSHAIPSRFPAVMKGRYKNFVYMTGDFADNKVKLTNSHFMGVTYLKHFFFLLDEESQREEFFWEFYVPLMRYVLEENYSEMNQDRP